MEPPAISVTKNIMVNRKSVERTSQAPLKLILFGFAMGFAVCSLMTSMTATKRIYLQELVWQTEKDEPQRLSLEEDGGDDKRNHSGLDCVDNMEEKNPSSENEQQIVVATKNPDNGDANDTERMTGISDQMNEICEEVLKKGKHGHKFVPWTTFMFCHTHKMEYRRDWLYPKATLAGETPSKNGGAPYQMAMQQYMGIALSSAQTTRYDYTVEPPKRLEGKRPRILFIGCGADTTFWQGTADYLGGTTVFVDFYENWAKACATQYGAESVIFQNITGIYKDQIGTLKELARPDVVEKKTSFLHLVNGDERYHQFALDLSDELAKASEEPWDIIVVDAPSGFVEGRAKPFYTALRIALSAPKDSFCRIYLHDTNRAGERLIARAFASFHPAVFLGNQMPRKGLFEWRVEGMSIPYGATSVPSTNKTSTF